jgi:hypothetical protein
LENKMSETGYPVSICPQRFRFEVDGEMVAIPCDWNHPIDHPNPAIERVVIVVHGVLRNADDYFPNMMTAVEQAGVADQTLVIAPQFLLEDDVIRFDLPNEILYWDGESGEGWKKGDDSAATESTPRTAAVSAFTVIDRLIERVANSEIFPHLKSIVVPGHSAGGQYVNRYAAGTQVNQSIPEKFHLRFIVANPSTYVYLNADRQISAETKEFGVPEGALPDYDDYKYGLRNLNPYMAAVGADSIRARYPHRDVVYLLGGEDTRAAMLEQTPSANLQGKNRLERGQVYYRYLQHLYGDEITQNHKIAVSPCVGHDNAALWKSEAGMRYLFE